MEELLIRNAKKIDENTPIPRVTEDNIFELFQLQTVADLRLMSRNFMRLSLFLDDIYGKFENKYVKNTDLATDTEAGILTLNKVREVAPQPDLSPFIQYDKSFIHKENNINSGHDFFVRCNSSDIWTPRHLHMYSGDDSNTYLGAFHINGGRAYYKTKDRNSGNWNTIMDNHDMAARDRRMNNMDTDRNNIKNRANDAWNKANDAQVNRIHDIRLAGYIFGVVWHANQGTERNGYVVTGVINHNSDNVIDTVQMRALQFHRNGQWLNAYFA